MKEKIKKYQYLGLAVVIFIAAIAMIVTYEPKKYKELSESKGNKTYTYDELIKMGAKPVEKNQEKDLIFDIDLSNLSYKLPNYTKICLPESRYDCSSSGCKIGKPAVFVLYDENTNKVYRCDKQPCDGYNISKEVSGLYTNLTPIVPNGSLVKLSEDNEYVEIVSMGLDFIIYRGKCAGKNKF